MGEYNSEDHYIYYGGKESLRKNGVAIINKRVWNSVLGCNLKSDRIISVHFQGNPFNIIIIQVYTPTSNVEKAEVERFCEDLQDLLELTPKKFLLCPSSAFSASGWITLTSFCVSSLPLFFRALIIFISFSTINDFKAPWKYKGCLNNKSLFWQMILRHLKRKN